MQLSKAAKAPQQGNGFHIAVRELIQELGFVYNEEVQVPRTKFVLDFYLPEFHVGVEADGPVHKKQVRRDQDRDFLILAESGILVFRIPQQEFQNNRGEVSKKLVTFCDKAWETIERRKNGS